MRKSDIFQNVQALRHVHTQYGIHASPESQRSAIQIICASDTLQNSDSDNDLNAEVWNALNRKMCPEESTEINGVWYRD
jgi:hypothetical protein